MVRAVAVDTGLLRRRRDFRLLVVGQVCSELGSMITFVALPYQAYVLTGSTWVVGLLAAVEFVPILGLALVGGALADSLDRRRLMQVAEVISLLGVLLLVGNALLPEPRVAVLFLAAVVTAGASAIRRPPMDALLPRLVEREELTAASALHWGLADGAMLVGPAVGGLVIAHLGFGVAYGLDALMFVVALRALAVMRTPAPPVGTGRASVASVKEGLRYAAGRPDLIGTYVVDMNAMFFGIPMVVFPALSLRWGGPEVVGLLYAAPALGSLLAAVSSGWTSRVHRHGRAIVWAAVGYGAAIIGFGLAAPLWAALGLLALAGAADAISGLFRVTLWNQTIPDELRGRLAGLEMLSWSSGPTLGGAEAGAAAALVGLRASVVVGGAACIAGSGVVVRALPAFWRYDARPPLSPGGRPAPAPATSS